MDFGIWLSEMDWRYGAIFAGGWVVGIFAEYFFHWIMHRVPLGFHINHHREFFHLEPKQVAINTLDPRLDLKFFALFLLALSPLMLWLDWRAVFLFWLGVFWHIVIVYELSHALMHYDAWAPRFFRESRLYRWWKGCHYEHHHHSPRGNYCVTVPIVDWFLGTYIPPREEYSPLPHPKLKPDGKGYSLPTPPSSEPRA